MKKTILKSIFLFSSVLLFSSCKRELDLYPTDNVSEEKAFRNLDDIQKGANGAYGLFGWKNVMYLNALLSDEVRIGPGNAGQGSFTFRFQYGSDATTGEDVTSVFINMYTMIDQVNRVLGAMEKLQFSEAELVKSKRIKAQLLALRAIGHFEVLKLYSKKYDASEKLGVSYMTKTDLYAQQPRETVSRTLELIEADFQASENLFNETGNQSFSDTVINAVNLAGFRARLALYKHDWANAAKYAGDVISANVKGLATGDDFIKIWTDAGNAETLFRIRYNNTPDVGEMWTTQSGANIFFSPSNKLIYSYDYVNDVRFWAYFDYDDNGNFFVNKFYESSRGGRVVDAKVMRIAEMYLIRAEANAQIGTVSSLESAADDLNLLRSMRLDGYADETFSSKAELLEAILFERFLELPFEGFRFDDIKRSGLSVERDEDDVDSPNWQTLSSSNFRMVLPLPLRETQANKRTEQNFGYIKN